jgi:cobalamin biosynthesis protein CbiD
MVYYTFNRRTVTGGSAAAAAAAAGIGLQLAEGGVQQQD